MSDQTTLYRHFNAAGELLYVGISINAFERFKQHSSDKKWIDHVANMTIERFPNRNLALKAEKSAIQKEKPKYNIVYNAGTGNSKEEDFDPSKWVIKPGEKDNLAFNETIDSSLRLNQNFLELKDGNLTGRLIIRNTKLEGSKYPFADDWEMYYYSHEQGGFSYHVFGDEEKRWNPLTFSLKDLKAASDQELLRVGWKRDSKDRWVYDQARQRDKIVSDFDEQSKGKCFWITAEDLIKLFSNEYDNFGFIRANDLCWNSDNWRQFRVEDLKKWDIPIVTNDALIITKTLWEHIFCILYRNDSNKKKVIQQELFELLINGKFPEKYKTRFTDKAIWDEDGRVNYYTLEEYGRLFS